MLTDPAIPLFFYNTWNDCHSAPVQNGKGPECFKKGIFQNMSSSLPAMRQASSLLYDEGGVWITPADF